MGAIERFLDGSVAHERVPEDVKPALTTMAWIAVAVVVVEVIFLEVVHSRIVPGLLVLAIEVALVVALFTAATTVGFRRADVSGQAVALALPVVAALPAVWAIASLLG